MNTEVEVMCTCDWVIIIISRHLVAQLNANVVIRQYDVVDQ